MPSYNKLVRDEIPRIIIEKGKTCNYKVLDSKDFVIELEKKWIEEVKEYLEAGNVEEATEELADMLEVVHAFANLRGIRMEDAEEIRQKKAVERGGFSKRLFLMDVIE